MFALKEDEKSITLNAYEEGAVIEGLNKLRTEQLEQNGDADFVSDLMLKIIRTPEKKVRRFGDPAKSCGDFAGKGGATEQESFCRDSGETSKRSPRRRDDAR